MKMTIEYYARAQEAIKKYEKGAYSTAILFPGKQRYLFLPCKHARTYVYSHQLYLSMMRRTKEDTEKTKNDLMRVAIKVFNENGYANTRLEDVAAAAGVSRGAIYYHFGSKAEIFKAIVFENKDQTMKLMIETMENYNGNKREGLQKVFRKYLTLIETNEFFRDVETLVFKTELSGELKDVENLFKLLTSEGHGKLLETLKLGKEDGSIRKDIDIEAFAFSLLSYHYGIMTIWIMNKDLISLSEKAEEISNYIFEACKA